jgi:Ca2+-binding RTX toxin-like protein
MNNINGGAGDDIIHGGGADGAIPGMNEVLYGGADDDTIFVETLAGQRAYAWGDGGNDSIVGGAGNESLFGGTGADTVEGGGGSNRMYDEDGAASGDVYRGGAGRDDLIYSGYASGATLDFSAAGADSWDSAIDSIQFMTAATVIGSSGIDRFAGAGNNADTFHGMDDNDWLMGNGGADFLSGGAGNDRLDGGLGSDTLTGGAGTDVLNGGIQGSFGGDGAADQFRFDAADFGTWDVIRDFELGLDSIGLSGTGLAVGAFDPGRFFAVGQTITGTAAALLYDQAHGVLYFDADGSGASAALGITLVTPGTALTASSIAVV